MCILERKERSEIGEMKRQVEQIRGVIEREIRTCGSEKGSEKIRGLFGSAIIYHS
jgi:hypothetical protein